MCSSDLWTKPQTAGWMFVPLTEYHGGGAAATIEPLREHLDAYESHLANTLGAGVQACWRGPAPHWPTRPVTHPPIC